MACCCTGGGARAHPRRAALRGAEPGGIDAVPVRGRAPSTGCSAPSTWPIWRSRSPATPTENLGLVRAAGLLLFGVFALKAALMPLHLWLPAAYAATSAPVAALFAIMTKVGAYCLLRVGTLIFGPEAGPLAGLYDPWLLPLALADPGARAPWGCSRPLGCAGRWPIWWWSRWVSCSLPSGSGLRRGIGAGLYYLAHSTFAAAALLPAGGRHRPGSRRARRIA